MHRVVVLQEINKVLKAARLKKVVIILLCVYMSQGSSSAQELIVLSFHHVP